MSEGDGNEDDQGLTHWLALQLDRDVSAIMATQREHTVLLNKITTTLQEHTGRFDSLEGQVRSLTQMMGEILRRLGPSENGDQDGGV